MTIQSTEGKETSKPVVAVYRAFALIEQLTKKRACGVTELALATGMTKTMVFRLLQTLQEIGILKKQKNDLYQLSMKLFSLGSHVLSELDIPVVAQSWMEQLSKECKETIHLAVREDDHIVYVHKIDTKYPMQLVSRVGQVTPIHSTAAGKVMLMHDSEEKIVDLLGEGPFFRCTDNTICDLSVFLKELENTRHNGFGVDNEEFENNIRSMAVPIRNYLNQIVAVLSVSIPTFRHDSNRDQDLLESMNKAASGISRGLGNEPVHSHIEW